MKFNKTWALILLTLSPLAWGAGNTNPTLQAGSIKNGSGTLNMNSSGTLTLPNSTGTLLTTAGNVATATALATDPTDCGSNSYAIAIDAQANLTCATVTDAGLFVSYIKADGTRGLSGNWNAGAHTITATTFVGALTGHASSDLQASSNLSDVNTPATAFNNISGFTLLGDMNYGGAAAARAVLPGNTTSTKKYLSQTGTGTVSAAPTWAQVACGDLSNSAASCSTDATNASNIGSGTLPAGRLPNPSSSTLGGIESLAAVSHNWINTISTSGVPAATQPACGDLSDSTTSCNTSNASANTASTLMKRDSNANVAANAFVGNYTTAATANSTTTLTVSSSRILFFTGSTAGQILVLPVTSTLPQVGDRFDITNNSTQTIAIQDSAAGAVKTQAASSRCILTALTSASPGTWDANCSVNNAGGGTVTSVALAVPNGFGVSGSPVTTNGTLTFTAPDESFGAKNLGLVTSVSSNILTVALKQADGSTNPSTGSSAVVVGMRNPTSATGGFNVRSITGALSQTLTLGTTLGLLASQNNYIYVYLIDSDGAGTMKIGLSPVKLDDGSVQSTIAESFSATATNASPAVFTATAHGMSNIMSVQLTGTPPTGFSTATRYYVQSKAANTFQLATTPAGTAVNSSSTGSSIVIHAAGAGLVSDAVYTNVAVRLIGRLQVNESTAGTWATNASEVSLAPTVWKPEMIAARYHPAGTTANATGVTNVFNFDTKDYDTVGAVQTDGTHWAFIAPVAGIYRITSFWMDDANNTWAVNKVQDMYLYKNNSLAETLDRFTVQQGTAFIQPVDHGADEIQLSAYDYIDLRIFQNSGGNRTITTGAWFSVSRAGPY